MTIALGAALASRPCRVLTSDVRVRVTATGLTTYPDVTVVCGSLAVAEDDAQAITNPVLLVEVLSDSTEANHRGAKAAHYRRIPTLLEYVLVSKNAPLIEVYRKNERGNWELVAEAREGDVAELTSVGATLDVRSIYSDRAPGAHCASRFTPE